MCQLFEVHLHKLILENKADRAPHFCVGGGYHAALLCDPGLPQSSRRQVSLGEPTVLYFPAKCGPHASLLRPSVACGTVTGKLCCCCCRVIGKGGETIKALQQYTGAMIQVGHSSTQE